MSGNRGLTYLGANMSAHVLLNLLNELRKRDKMRCLLNILSLFRTDFNNILPSFTQRYNGRHYVTLLNL